MLNEDSVEKVNVIFASLIAKGYVTIEEDSATIMLTLKGKEVAMAKWDVLEADVRAMFMLHVFDLRDSAAEDIE